MRWCPKCREPKPGRDCYDCFGRTRPMIVCFCGSSRFVNEMAILRWEYEKQGYITLGLHLLPQGYCEKYGEDGSGHLAELQDCADAMDRLHLEKIDISDLVVIVNIGGYIGSSTRREIAYTESLHKTITYIEELKS